MTLPRRRSSGLKMLVLATVSRPGTYGRMRSTTNLVIEVNPARIHSYVTKFPLKQRYSHERHPFVLGDLDFPTPINVEDENNYLRMSDAMKNIQDVTQSLAYRNACLQLDSHGIASFRGRKAQTRQEAQEIIERYVRELVTSIRQNGYDDRFGPPGLAAIGSDGELLKSGRGHHRFTVARELGIARIPLEVHLVHEDWASSWGWDAERNAFSSRKRLATGLEAVARSFSD